MTTGILLLAAGRAVRFGSDKRLASLACGRRVIEVTLANIRASGLPVITCLGPGDDELVRHLEPLAVDWLRCDRAGEGMGATLAQGVGHLPGWDGVLVAMADMPWILPATYRAVAMRLDAGTIAVPTHSGRRGHPVGFGRDFYPALATLGGDTGARRLLGSHGASVIEVPVADPAIHRDIDSPADLSFA